MGTAAVFAIATEDNRIWSKIIGMTSDGFPENLLIIAKQFKSAAETMAGGLDLSNGDNVVRIFQKLCKNDDGLFIDNSKNAQWVSYSAIFNPFTGKVTIYEEKFEDVIKTVNIGKVDTMKNVEPDDVVVRGGYGESITDTKNKLTESEHIRNMLNILK